VRETLFTGPECQGICPGDPVADGVGAAARALRSGRAAPTPREELLLVQSRAALEEVLSGVNRALAGVADVVRAAQAEGLDADVELAPVTHPGAPGAGAGRDAIPDEG
jgi:hypothetical protein